MSINPRTDFVTPILEVGLLVLNLEIFFCFLLETVLCLQHDFLFQQKFPTG